MGAAERPRGRKPPWLRVRAPGGKEYTRLKELLRRLDLHTVCEEAHCPNQGECWGEGTATVMLLGDICTRSCRFCAVQTGNPQGALDPDEPEKVGEAVEALGLRYVVLTSVDRDDLPDGGAGHFALTVEAVKRRRPDIRVEVLTPDFRGDRAAITRVACSGADVLGHNIETVRRLTRSVRDPRCSYDVSLSVLRVFREAGRGALTKSSMLLGLGETQQDVEDALDDLRRVGVDMVTLGQYLCPSASHAPVAEYIPPERFRTLEELARSKGFGFVASGPLVRSSYRAGELYVQKALM